MPLQFVNDVLGSFLTLRIANIPSILWANYKMTLED